MELLPILTISVAAVIVLMTIIVFAITPPMHLVTYVDGQTLMETFKDNVVCWGTDEKRIQI